MSADFRGKAVPVPELFFIGAQGPDFFYYYNPLNTANDLYREGDRLHDLSGGAFFLSAVKRVHTLPAGTKKDAATSYLYGILTHFLLDSRCHAYINAVSAKGTFTHADLEGFFDRALLLEDGYDPVQKNLTERFHPTEAAADAISVLYPAVSRLQILRALTHFVRIHRFLHCSTSIRRTYLYGLLRFTGQYRELRGHIMPAVTPASYEVHHKRLRAMYEEAIADALRLLPTFPADLRDDRYRYDFNGRRVSDGSPDARGRRDDNGHPGSPDSQEDAPGANLRSGFTAPSAGGTEP